MGNRVVFTVVLLWSAAFCGCLSAEEPRPAPVKRFVVPATGEHPWLFFEQADLQELRRRATEIAEADQFACSRI
jgi:hypothetical protein